MGELGRAARGHPGDEVSVKSRVDVEATELNADETGWVTAGVFIHREGETDPELAEQYLDLNHGELRALYDGLRLYFEQGIWSTRTVEGSD